MTLGQKLRERRESLGLTRIQVARACHVVQSTVINWETDRQTRAQALPSKVRSPVRSTEVYDRGFGGIVWGVAAGELDDRTFGRKGDRTFRL